MSYQLGIRPVIRYCYRSFLMYDSFPSCITPLLMKGVYPVSRPIFITLRKVLSMGERLISPRRLSEISFIMAWSCGTKLMLPTVRLQARRLLTPPAWPCKAFRIGVPSPEITIGLHCAYLGLMYPVTLNEIHRAKKLVSTSVTWPAWTNPMTGMIDEG